MPSDTFNRSDVDPMVGNWTGYAYPFQILSNRAVADTDGFCAVAWTADNFADDHSSQVEMPEILSSNRVGVMVRMTYDSGLYGYLFENDNGVYRIKKIAAGSPTQLGADLSGTPTNGDTLKLVVTGTTLEAFVNGASKGTRTDSDYATGRAGIAGYYGYFDNWVGEDVGGGGPSIPILSNHYKQQQ